MIRHTVSFSLKHPVDSPEAAVFLAAADVLAGIPGVERFEKLRQVSAKNSFDYGFSMEFADRSAFEAYNEHPDHVAFVTDRWQHEVSDFLETDYEPLETAG